MTQESIEKKNVEEQLYLQKLTGLRVVATVTEKHNIRVFRFYDGERSVKEVFTYPKAKLFAQGFVIGKNFKRD